MVRITERVWDRLRSLGTLWRVAGTLLLVCALIAVLLAVSRCSKSTQSMNGNGASADATAAVTSGHMAGPPVTVYVSQDVVRSRQPQQWDLRTPQSAVRSYLVWVSYAYRIGNSQVATPTMSPPEEVRMDSYCQYNLEKKRLLDEKLDSITFGKPSRTATATLLPTQESWTYSYLSVDKGNPRIGGPYSIKYTSTYKVYRNGQGDWVVDSVNAKALGTVK